MFTDITGQTRVKKYLAHAAETGRIHHAYAFVGDKGTPKKEIAVAFAEKIAATSTDVRLVQKAKTKTIITVNDVREQIGNDIQIKPYKEGKKIYIVEDAGLMNEQAQNALLKTLEEPPEYAVIILLVESMEQLIDTVRSRCMKVDFDPAYDPASQKELIDLVSSVSTLPMGDILRALKGAKETLNDVGDILDVFLMWYRDVLVYKSCRDSNLLIFKSEENRVMKAADALSYRDIRRICEGIKLLRERSVYNIDFELSAGLFFMDVRDRMAQR